VLNPYLSRSLFLFTRRKKSAAFPEAYLFSFCLSTRMLKSQSDSLHCVFHNIMVESPVSIPDREEMRMTTYRTPISLLILLFLFFSSAVLIGAGTDEAAPFPSEETACCQAEDALGRSVKLAREPQRIAIAGRASMIAADALTLFSSKQAAVTALGQTDQGLGDFYELLLPSLSSGERLPHSVGAEAIAAGKPDLVITKERNFSLFGEQLELLDIPVFTVGLENPDDYIKEIKELGKLLNRDAEAEMITGIFRSRLERVRDRTAAIPADERETVLMLYLTSTEEALTFQVPPASWIQTFMAEQAGAAAVWAEEAVTDNWQTVTFEQISAWNPDRIYIISYRTPAGSFIGRLANSPLWQELAAYRRGTITAFPADYHSWAQPDTRWILGLEWLASDLHPQLFSDVSMEELVTDFYRSLYRITDEQALEDILARYRSSLGTVESR
jgi:iron complex transport system substrate-binding protein